MSGQANWLTPSRRSSSGGSRRSGGSRQNRCVHALRRNRPRRSSSHHTQRALQARLFPCVVARNGLAGHDVFNSGRSGLALRRKLGACDRCLRKFQSQKRNVVVDRIDRRSRSCNGLRKLRQRRRPLASRQRAALKLTTGALRPQVVAHTQVVAHFIGKRVRRRRRRELGEQHCVSSFF